MMSRGKLLALNEQPRRQLTPSLEHNVPELLVSAQVKKRAAKLRIRVSTDFVGLDKEQD